MKYNTQEKLAEDAKKRKRQAMELGDLYVECESYEEFKVRSALDLCYTVPKWFDKFWWHYLIANYSFGGIISCLIGFIILINVLFGLVLYWCEMISILMFSISMVSICPIICIVCALIVRSWDNDVLNTKLDKSKFSCIASWERSYYDKLWGYN